MRRRSSITLVPAHEFARSLESPQRARWMGKLIFAVCAIGEKQLPAERGHEIEEANDSRIYCRGQRACTVRHGARISAITCGYLILTVHRPGRRWNSEVTAESFVSAPLYYLLLTLGSAESIRRKLVDIGRAERMSYLEQKLKALA